MDGTVQTAAAANFTVQNGQILASSLQIVSPGTYLVLPESRPDSGVYALLLDVFSTGIASTPVPDGGELGNVMAAMPMLTLDSSHANAPLQIQAAQRISKVAVSPSVQSPTLLYPQYNASSQQISPAASTDNSAYTYSNVVVQLFATAQSGGTPTLVNLLNPSAAASNAITATVTLSGGVIQNVALDQALLFAPHPAGTSLAVQLTLPAAVISSLPQGTPAPSYVVTPESLSFNNLVADEQFSAQQGLADAGVYIAAGLSDQLPLVGSMASWPVQNRVAYVSTTGSSGNAQTSVVYLNGIERNSQGGTTPKAVVTPSELSLEEIYSNHDLVFSAASTPTAATLAGPVGSTTHGGKTFVAWVEATDPVIPNSTTANGEANYQAFMDALYGNQRINYRINLGGDAGWFAPNTSDLYAPDNAIIRHLQAFTLDNPAAPGGSATLLVWDETSIAAIKGAVESMGSMGSLESMGSIPTQIKAGWINTTNPKTLQWADLFLDSDGNSTIQTIPWDQSTDVGLTIQDIALATQSVVQADSSVEDLPLLSWSQDVRTPYRESILQDLPTLYLQFSDLQAGISDINIGRVNSSYTSTFASQVGLNFAIAGALPKSQATAVQNVEGIGVLSTGMGTNNSSIRHLTNNVPQGTIIANSPVARFEGAIAGTTLTVTAVTAGQLAAGALLSGAGLLPGTTIVALETVDGSTGVGTYTLNQSQTLPTSTWIAVPDVSQLPLTSFAGSVAGSILTVTALSQGNLAVGDQISGPGIPNGTTIIGLISSDPGSGLATYTLDRSLSTPIPPSALLGSPGSPVAPYTIEFWAQLQPGSNPNGAGLVALGQPSAAAIGASTLPDGWVLNASFVVDRVTVQQAAARGLISSIPSTDSDPANTLYGWEWGLVATGASSTAMGGNGGSNLYSNALLLNNLNSGQTIAGVSQFLANYDLTAADLIGSSGFDVTTIATVPMTQLQFTTDLDPSTGLPNSSLNNIAVDTSTAVLNQGLLRVSDGISASLTTMFEALWNFESKTSEAKVNFSLAPSSSGTTSSPGQLPSALAMESYAGYELGFSLARGTAVSVNGAGQLVFDIGQTSSIVSAATGSVPADLRDGQWHYVVASFLPTYQTYDASGVTIELPTNTGTASLFIDNQLVASNTSVFNPYPLMSLNDEALLLAGNSGGAIDQLAVYDKALSSAAFVPNTSGQWPMPSAEDALALLDELGFAIASQTPDPGAIPGAVTKHWLARTVNPNAAALATYTSTYNTATNSWSQAATLNPLLQVEATIPSFSTSGNRQDTLLVNVPTSNWTSVSWTSNGSSTFFNPANQLLTAVHVVLDNLDDSSQSASSLQLTPDQVFLGSQSLESLAPQASDANYGFTILSNAPSFSFHIPKADLPASTDPLRERYSVTYSFVFSDTTTITTTYTTIQASMPLVVNAQGATLASDQLVNASTVQLGELQAHATALATSAVIEQAPLQLKYVDSGVVLSSAADAAAASSQAIPVPANSFGQSQVIGSFTDSSGYSNGWLAIAQPFSANSVSNPAGRVWIQYTGQSKDGQASSNVAQAPTTWLNALARSSFSSDAVNLPLLGDAYNPSSSGGLLIKADPTAGWGQNFGQTMLVADVNHDGTPDLIIAAPQANGGGRVLIIDGAWMATSLTSTDGATVLDLSNPTNLGSYVTVLMASSPSSSTDDISVANFGLAMAFDPSTESLWIGAPNYLRQLNPASSDALSSLVPIGALYRYSTSASEPQGWGTGIAQSLSADALGSGGTTTSPGAGGSPTTSYWGSQFASAIAVNGSGGIAVSAPGLQASLLYSGTEAVQQQAAGKKNPSDLYGDGALIKIQLPSNLASNALSSVEGTSNPGLLDVVSQDAGTHSTLANRESAAMQTLKALQVDTIAQATYNNNQAIQTAAVGAVYLWNSSADLAAISTPIDAAAVANSSAGGATFYGPNPWNTLGATGFGSSLSFGDFTNTNASSILAIGAPQAGGSGALYLLDTSQPFTKAASAQPEWLSAINLANGSQYLAHLSSTMTLYGAAAADNFANALLDLGDVNNDGYDDLLIQAYNASSGAGNGYVLFGSDQLSQATSSDGLPNPGSGSVAAGAIGQVKRADGTSLNLSILSELGHGFAGYTGQGAFGAGDVNGDGIHDVPLGSGPNGEAYLTWGHPYLEAINSLQLSKLASDSGYLLDGLATSTQGSLRAIGDFNGDGYGDFISINPGSYLTTVRLELGANTEEVLADYPYNFYSFSVANGTDVMAAGDVNADGFSDIALFTDTNVSSAAEGNQGAGSSTAILFGRASTSLPLGSGFGLIAPVDPNTNGPLLPLPGTAVAGGLTDASPSVIAVGSTLYAAVKGVGSGDTSLWFNQSLDGGSSWSNWINLSGINSAFASNSGPSLAYFNNTLQLAFLTTSGTLSLASWDPAGNSPLSWSTPGSITDSSGEAFSSSFAPQLLSGADALRVLWVDEGSATLQVASTTTPASVVFSSPSQLLRRVGEGSSVTFAPISATSAPTAAYLADVPVVAVNDGGTIEVYAALSGSLTLQRTSTFTAAIAGPAISSAPVLGATPTGLALTYSTADGSISLNRLDVVNNNGSPLESDADLRWQSTTLTAANSDLSSSVASVPLSVDGVLVLANVRNSTSQANQIWINAVPNLNDPDSTTWLNSTVQLSDGSGGWSISQQAGSEAPIALTPSWAVLSSGQSPEPPAFAEANGVLYVAVRGTNNDLYWASSSNGGQSWTSWQQLPGGMTTDQAPGLAVVNDTLYLAYLGNGNTEINITSLTNATNNTWSGQYQIPNQGAKTLAMLNENGSLVLYYQGTNDNLYRTATATPNSASNWTENAIQYGAGSATQTSSGQLAATMVGSTTYLAYQGGTSSSPSNTIFLTSSSSQSTASSWVLIDGVPQASSASDSAHSGVGLTTLADSLILSYADEVSDSPVLALQQGTVSNSSWRGAPYASLTSPGTTTSPAASLFVPSGSSQVLVASINGNSNPVQDISTTFVSAQDLDELLTSKQTGSSLTPVGDVNNDGYADLLVSANNVVANTASGRQLVTGLRLISGAATSSAIATTNDSSSSNQSVLLASPFSQGSATPVASIRGTDSADGDLLLSIGAANGSSISALSASLSPAALTASATTVAQASSALASATSTTLSLDAANGWGQAALNGAGSYGDLNADGRLDFFDPAGNNAIATAAGVGFYSLWSIRAAGDVNGNGVDDVLLALSPNGPAYGQVTTGLPSALQSVLVDGSLFKVDTTTNSFRLDQLRNPLNPYNASQLYDVSSTSTSLYEPSLQNWFDPILNFKAGAALSAASTSNGVNPDGAESYSSPAVAISPEGDPYFIYSGHANSKGGLWMAYQDASSSWQQSQLSVGSDATTLAPSAVFYQGKLTIAYTDTSGDLHVAWCDGNPQSSTSTWSSYQVVTSANESSQWNPTLVVEQGRLALYFPSNAGSTVQQSIRYLYSTDPFDSSSNGNWGGSLNSTRNGYSGISGTLSAGGSQPIVTSPIAATSYHGRTVLAFRSYTKGMGNNVDNGTIQLVTQVASDPTTTATSQSLSWVLTNTNQSGSNGVGLATDQGLLYLTSTSYVTWNVGNPAPYMWSLSPGSTAGTWTLGTSVSVDGPGFPAEFYYGANPLYADVGSATVLTPFLQEGRLMATWAGGYGSNTGDSFNLQVADLSATIGLPTQQSLAGFSLDGNIDINGDGFKDVLISDPSDPKLSVDNQYSLFGGDYLNIASQVGTAGNDTLVGTPQADVIYSIQGADRVISFGGADVIYTGAGDDSVSILNGDFIRIDAGSGFDQLLLQGLANQNYDFRLSIPTPEYFAGTKLRDFELISSVDYGANTLSFDRAAVNAINSDRILFLTVDAVDDIVLSSEFQRNAAFDTSFQGQVWSAFAAGIQATPEDSSPTLVYVLNNAQVSAADTAAPASAASTPASSQALKAGALGVAAAAALPGAAALPTPTALIGSTPFGSGLTLLAYQANSIAGEARFAIERQDGRRRQVVAYLSSSRNSTAEPGRHYDPVIGLLALEEGELRKEISVPLLVDSFAALGGASLSLAVEELEEAGQEPLHLVLSLDPDGQANGSRPAVSGASLTPTVSGDSASFTFRADTNSSSAGSSLLAFQLRQRSQADSRDSVLSEQIQILDQDVRADEPLALHLANRVGVSLDRDHLLNEQVSAEVALLFSLDRSAPTVSGVATLTASGLYGIGTVIPITVTFSEAVTVDSSAGLPSLLLETGSSDRQVLYSAGSGSRTLTFLYTVQAGDRTPQLTYTSAGALLLNGATIQDAAGNNADLSLPEPDALGSLAASAMLLIDGVAPAVTSIASANANGTYGPGALITLTARFSEPVRVNLSGGVPSLLLETGAVDRAATYIAGSGSDTLTFGYTVQSGDSASDLDLVANTPLALNGATLLDAAGNPADLKLPAAGAPGSLAATADLVIVGVTPQSLVISTATAVIEEGATLAVALRSDTLAPGATLHWRFSGPGITAADFSPEGLSGSIPLGSDRRAAFSRSIALDALTEGDEALTLEFFADAARSQSLGRTLFTIRDVVPKPLAGATDGRDLLIGTAADEIISGVPVLSALQGRGSYDTLTGNGGRDLFILGTASAVYYDDGLSTSSGASDLAAITDFSPGDRLQLQGSAANYRLATGRVSGASGLMLYRRPAASPSSPAASDELIGFLKGLTPAHLNLTDPNQILYV